MAINLGVIFSEIRLQLSGLEEDAAAAKETLAGVHDALSATATAAGAAASAGFDEAGASARDLDGHLGAARDALLGAQDALGATGAAASAAASEVGEAGAHADDAGGHFSRLLAPLQAVKQHFADLSNHVSTMLAPVGDAIDGVSQFGARVKDATDHAMAPFVAAGEKVKGGFEKIGGAASKVLAPIGHVASGFGDVAAGAFKIAGGAALFTGLTAGVSLLTDQLGSCINAAKEQQQVLAQTSAVLKSTHDASGMTAESMHALAEQFQRTTPYSEDVALSAQNLLATFTNISGKTFPRASQAALDMATAMHIGPTQAALQLGKALNDPAKGLSMLTREGVTFTDAQKQQITAMEKAGNTAGAQAIMLKELEREFGGSAAAAGNTFAGSLQRAQNALEDVKAKVGNAVMPILADLTQKVIAPLVSKLADALPGALKVVSGLFGNLQTALAPVFAALPSIGAAVGRLADAFQAGLKPALAAIGKAFSGVQAPGGDLKTFMSQLLTTLTNLAPTAKQFGQFLGQLAALVVTNVVPAIQQLASFAAKYVLPALLQLGQFIGTTVLPVVKSLATVFVRNILPAIQQVASTVLTRLLPPLEHLGRVVLPMLQPAFGLIGWLAQTIVAPALSLIASGLGLLIDGLATVISWVSNFVQKVVGFFQGLADTLVGHSIIPDMAAKILSTIFNLVTGFLGHIKDLVLGVLTHFGALEVQAIQKIKDLVGSILGKLGDLKDAAIQKAKDLATDFLSALADLPKKMLDLGGQIVQGLINGLKNAAGNLGGAVKNLGGNLLGGVKSFFGIASPSKVMAEIGTFLSQGLVQGMQSIDVAGAAARHYGGVVSAAVAGRPGAAGSVAGANAGGPYVDLRGLTVQVNAESGDGSPTSAGTAFGRALGTALGPALSTALRQHGY